MGRDRDREEAPDAVHEQRAAGFCQGVKRARLGLCPAAGLIDSYWLVKKAFKSLLAAYLLTGQVVTFVSRLRPLMLQINS